MPHAVHRAATRVPDWIDSAARAGYVATGVIVGWLAVETAFGGGGASAGGTEQRTATLMSWPGGRWVVGLAGPVVIGVGVRESCRAQAETCRRRLGIPDLGRTPRRWVSPGRGSGSPAGNAARHSSP